MDLVVVWLLAARSQLSKALLGLSMSILTSAGPIGGQCLVAFKGKQK